MSPRPFRFAVTVGHAAGRRKLAEIVRRAEDTGFSVLGGVDHIGPPLGVLPLLATTAQMSTLRVSPMVAANDYRHPVQLARDSATIDILSDGRFELGIGTGWIKAQYDSAGIAYDSPKVRVDRFAEAIAVIRGCWTGERFSFHGEHYRVDLAGGPKPVQRPHPPILIAASGPRMLRLAGRQASIVGLTVTQGQTGFDTFAAALAGSAERIDEQLAAVREGAGDRFDEIELSVMIHGHLPDDAAVERLATETGVSAGRIGRSPHLLIGGRSRMIDALEERRERHGLSYIAVRGAHMETMAPVVEQLAGR